MTIAKTKVYVSYSWGVEDKTSIVDVLQPLCEARGIELNRDRNAMGYADLIDRFMEKLIVSEHIITVISRQYLESEYCMTELLGIYTHHGEKDFFKRINPD